MDNQDRIQGGLDVIRREAKGARGKDRSWKKHNRLMRAALTARGRLHRQAKSGTDT